MAFQTKWVKAAVVFLLKLVSLSSATGLLHANGTLMLDVEYERPFLSVIHDVALLEISTARKGVGIQPIRISRYAARTPLSALSTKLKSTSFNCSVHHSLSKTSRHHIPFGSHLRETLLYSPTGPVDIQQRHSWFLSRRCFSQAW